MYSRYDPTAHGPFRPIAEDGVTEQAPPLPAAQRRAGGLLDGLNGLLGRLRRGGTAPLDLGDLLLLAVIALLVLEDGGESDLIIVLAIALIVGF